MRYLQHSLFGGFAFEPRKTADQTEFEKKHEKLLYAFPGFVDQAFIRLNKEIYATIEAQSRDKNLPAVAISGFLKGQIIHEFPDYCAKATKKRFKLKHDNSEWIYVKKLNSKKLPSNVKTDANDMIIAQLSDSENDTEPNVFLGYIASSCNTQANEVYAVYIRNNKVIWYTDLRLFADMINERNPNTQLPVSGNEIEIKSDVVKIKKASGDK